MPAPAYETLDEAAAHLHVHKRTIQLWIYKGRLRGFHRAGDKRTWVRSSDVKRLAQPRPKPARTGVSSASSTG